MCTLLYAPSIAAILFRIVERFIVIGRAILDAPHRKVSTIVFLSSIVEVLPLFTNMGIRASHWKGKFFNPSWNIHLSIQLNPTKAPEG